MPRVLTGVRGARAAHHNVYLCYAQLAFPEPGTRIVRTGAMTVVLPRSDTRPWRALIGKWLFTPTWNANTNEYDESADIFGKPCYVGRWLDSNRRWDIADSSMIEVQQLVGCTIGETIAFGHRFAVVVLAPEFMRSAAFQLGVWASTDNPGVCSA